MKSYPEFTSVMFSFGTVTKQDHVVVHFNLKERMAEVRNNFYKQKYKASNNPSVQEAESLMSQFLETPINKLKPNR